MWLPVDPKVTIHGWSLRSRIQNIQSTIQIVASIKSCFLFSGFEMRHYYCLCCSCFRALGSLNTAGLNLIMFTWLNREGFCCVIECVSRLYGVSQLCAKSCSVPIDKVGNEFKVSLHLFFCSSMQLRLSLVMSWVCFAIWRSRGK